jgi:hypothetical protein
MLAAHHFHLSAEAIRRVYEQPSAQRDVLLSDFFTNLGANQVRPKTMQDDPLYEAGFIPQDAAYGTKFTLARRGFDILNKCSQLSTTAELQKATESLCNSVANPAMGSICQDLEDVLDYDHCDETVRAQASHFMRPTNATPEVAYQAAVDWIATNLGLAATGMAAQLAARQAGQTGILLTSGKPSKHLGRALHAVQDSFSEAHVRRSQGAKGSPGIIKDIFAFRTQNQSDHKRLAHLIHSRNGVLHRLSHEL